MNQYGNNENGYVLLVVLVILQIVSCLGLYELVSLSASMRVNNHRLVYIARQFQARQVLAKIEQNMLNNKINCFTRLTSVSDFTKKSLEWWQQYACYHFDSKQHYYYVIELMEADLTIKYYRITLLAVPAKMQIAKLILQSVVTISSEDQGITLNRQMIREIY